jgi:membrane protein DedA with SNARE-associated domain
MTGYFELISQALSTLNQGNVFALAALFLVLALGEMGVPFPFVLQGVLFFIGYQITQGAGVRLIPVVVVLVMGRQFGSAVVYFVARFLGKPFVDRIGKVFPSWQSQPDKLKRKLSKGAPVAIAIGRLTPGLLVPTSLTSGAIGLRYEYFALGIALSTIVWDGTFIASGTILGSSVQRLGLTIPSWSILAGFITAISLIWVVRRFLLWRKGR